MNGRHTAPWALYQEDGTVDTVFPPTGKPFAMTQSHWFRLADGRIIEHWANRDDLGMARQLGWIPPSASAVVSSVPVSSSTPAAPRLSEISAEISAGISAASETSVVSGVSQSTP